MLAHASKVLPIQPPVVGYLPWVGWSAEAGHIDNELSFSKVTTVPAFTLITFGTNPVFVYDT